MSPAFFFISKTFCSLFCCLANIRKSKTRNIISKNFIAYKMNIFLQPFPFDHRLKAKLASTCLISIGIFFILYVFQPFGLSLLPSSTQLPIIAGYGVVCFVIQFLNRFLLVYLLPKIFKEANWKVYKEIIWYCYNILTVALANFVYSYWLGIYDFSLPDFLRILTITFLVALLPLSLIAVLRYNYLLNKHLKQLVELNQELQKYHTLYLPKHPTEEVLSQSLTPIQVLLPSEEKNGNLWLAISELLFVKADDNYLEVFYIQDAKIKKSVLRNTLKNIEVILENHEEIFRCHRSYLVNLQNVKNITGNSQGYRLSFANVDFEVPVARSFAKELKEKMQVSS